MAQHETVRLGKGIGQVKQRRDLGNGHRHILIGPCHDAFFYSPSPLYHVYCPFPLVVETLLGGTSAG